MMTFSFKTVVSSKKHTGVGIYFCAIAFACLIWFPPLTHSDEDHAKILESDLGTNDVLSLKIKDGSNYFCSNAKCSEKNKHSRSKRQLAYVNTNLDEENCHDIRREIDNSKLEEKRLKRCYYCNSSTKEVQHKCGNELFQMLLISEKKDFKYQCPWKNGNYCYKRHSWNKTWAMTQRGCAGEDPLIFPDRHAFHITSKCAYLDNGIYNSILCFCDTDLCNAGRNNFPSVIFNTMSLFVLVSIWNNY